MRTVLTALVLSLCSSPVLAQDTWRFSIDGHEYSVPKSVNGSAIDCESAISSAKQQHATLGRGQSEVRMSAPLADIRDFRGIVLAVGPDGNTGMVTASTRGTPTPVIAVYHNGYAATHWAPLPVSQLPATQRVTSAEQFTRTVPASTTANAVGKPVCVT